MFIVKIYKLKEMLIQSLGKYYEDILSGLKEAEIALEQNNQVHYSSLLSISKNKIKAAEKLISAWTEQENSIALNLRLLNNYYKHLLSQALDKPQQDKSIIAELKYHLLELIDSCKSH